MALSLEHHSIPGRAHLARAAEEGLGGGRRKVAGANAAPSTWGGALGMLFHFIVIFPYLLIFMECHFLNPCHSLRVVVLSPMQR